MLCLHKFDVDIRLDCGKRMGDEGVIYWVRVIFLRGVVIMCARENSFFLNYFFFKGSHPSLKFLMRDILQCSSG